MPEIAPVIPIMSFIRTTRFINLSCKYTCSLLILRTILLNKTEIERKRQMCSSWSSEKSTGIVGGLVFLSYLYLKNKSQKVAEHTKKNSHEKYENKSGQGRKRYVTSRFG